MSGGFIPDSESSTSNRTSGTHRNGDQAQGQKPGRPLLALTQRQEVRLRSHLDDKLLQLERDERKHAFGSLPLLLVRLHPILSLILQIPPPEPWGGLRISYLLTFTGAITTYLTSLPLVANLEPSDADRDGVVPDDEVSTTEERSVNAQAAQTMRQFLDFLNEVDIGWQAVLRGDAWTAPAREGGRGRPVRIDFGSTVDATARIRLRSIIIAGREKLLAWARTYGHFTGSAYPPTPSASTSDDEEDETDGWEWENEVVALWNGTLEMLSDLDFAEAGV